MRGEPSTCTTAGISWRRAGSLQRPGARRAPDARWYGNVRKKGGWRFNELKTVATFYGVNLELPWKDLPQQFRDVVLWGSEDKIPFKWENEAGTWKGEGQRQERGAVFHINRLFRQTQSEYTRRWYMSFMSSQPCPVCKGRRLRPESLFQG